MKTWLAIASVVLVWRIAGDVRAHYDYERRIASYWNLGVKASTLDMKAEYLNRFVAALDSAHLEGFNALIFPTPDNSIAQNTATLKSLQARLAEVRGMDVTSFAYQQAMSQITAQEQDEAARMLGVFKGVWYLNHHPLYWDWVGVVLYLVLAALWCVPPLKWLSEV